jgi:cystathionine beta-synthase
MTRRLAREEGLLTGGSCGMAAAAALRLAERCGPDDVIVVLLPDGGRGYLTKVFNDQWMASYGFLPPEHSGAAVGDVLRRKDGMLPKLVHVHPSETVGDAVAVLREFGVSQMPVVAAEPPVMAAEVVGAVNERDLLEALFTGKAALADRVDKHMSVPLPTIGAGEQITAAMSALSSADGAMVLIDGKPAGVVTRQDLLGFLAGR